MPYVTVDELADYIPQVDAEGDAALLGDIIDRAQSIVDEYMGFTFDGYDASASERVITAYGTPTLILPPHEIGTITTVTLEGATTAIDEDDYTEDTVTGNLTFNGYYPFTGYGYYPYNQFSPFGYWGPARYEVTAKWGYGTVPEAIKEVTLELAVNIWRGRDRGMWTDVIGVEGSGGLRFTGGVTNQQRAILDSVRERYMGSVAI